MLLQRAIVTNDPAVVDSGVDDVDFEGLDDLDEDSLDDPEGIAIPWEEEYGKKRKKKKSRSRSKK